MVTKKVESSGDGTYRNAAYTDAADDARSIMLNRVSWGAVLAGVVVALVVQLILNMIGVGIGAATLDPGTSDNPAAATLSIGSGIWFAVCGIIAALLGGYTAGRLSGTPKASTAAWHGLTVWALSALLVVFLVGSSVGGILGSTFNTMTNAMGSLANVAGSTVKTAAVATEDIDNPFASIEQSIKGAVPGDADPATLREAAVASMRAVVTGNEAKAEKAREQAAQALSNAQNIPLPEARAQVEEYEAEYRQSMEEAQPVAADVADTAAAAISTSALLAALGLILGAVAGWFGGRKGWVALPSTAHTRTYT